MQTAIIDRVIDGLQINGALQPYPVDAVAEDLGLFLNHPTALPPAAAPLVRFHRAKQVLTQHGRGDHDHLQRFFSWQKGFIGRGLELYFPQRDFRDWIQTTLPSLAQEPLSPSYRQRVADHLAKITMIPSMVSSFPLVKEEARSERPAFGNRKESVGNVKLASSVFRNHPQLLLTSAVFQGLHLQFLDEISDRLKQRSDVSPENRGVFGEAVKWLGINITNANFVRLAVWTGIAHSRRLVEAGQESDALVANDFLAGWHLVEKGGGFSQNF